MRHLHDLLSYWCIKLQFVRVNQGHRHGDVKGEASPTVSKSGDILLSSLNSSCDLRVFFLDMNYYDLFTCTTQVGSFSLINRKSKHRRAAKLAACPAMPIPKVYTFLPNFSLIGVHCYICGVKTCQTTAKNHDIYQIFNFVLVPLAAKFVVL